MNYAFLIIGIILFFLTIFDLIWTTLWVDGGACPLSSMIGNFVWFVFGKIDKRGTGLKKFVGPVVLMSILVIWITTLWLAWTLIFASFIGGVVNTARNDAITMVDYLYYAGYVLFTLGNGEITPTNGTVQLLTSLASASGMLNLSFVKGDLFELSNIKDPKFNNIQFIPLKYGGGMMSVYISPMMSPLFDAPQIIGHNGLSGSFAFYCPEKDTFIAGNLNEFNPNTFSWIYQYLNAFK